MNKTKIEEVKHTLYLLDRVLENDLSDVRDDFERSLVYSIELLRDAIELIIEGSTPPVVNLSMNLPSSVDKDIYQEFNSKEVNGRVP